MADHVTCGQCHRTVPVIPGLFNIDIAHVDPHGRPCSGEHISYTYTHSDRVWADDRLWEDFMGPNACDEPCDRCGRRGWTKAVDLRPFGGTCCFGCLFQ
jgi:hypothetical protein